MAHDHSHGHPADAHGHAHGHAGTGHVHAPASFGRAFAIGIALNIAYVVVEAGFGLASGSLALVADAGHNLSDVFGLAVAWAAAWAAAKPPAGRRTYGFKRTPILGSLANAMLLLVAVGAIAWEAGQRLLHPEPVATATVLWVAVVGVVVNAGTAALFMAGSKDDLNIRGAFLHMAADAGVTVGVIVTALLIAGTGWLWLDPAISLVIALVILLTTWGLLRDAVLLAIDAVPPGIDLAAVRAFLRGLPGVGDLHDLHVWALSTTDTALTCHLVMPAGHPGDAFLLRAADELHGRFGIGHATLQVERSGQACRLASDEVV